MSVRPSVKLMYHHAQIEIERRAVRRYECTGRSRDRVTRVVVVGSCAVRIKRAVGDLFRQGIRIIRLAILTRV